MPKNTQWIPVDPSGFFSGPGRSIASVAALIPPAPDSAVHPPASKPSKPRLGATSLAPPQRTRRMAASASASDAWCTKGCGTNVAICQDVGLKFYQICGSNLCVDCWTCFSTACSTVGFQKKGLVMKKSLAWAQQKHGPAGSPCQQISGFRCFTGLNWPWLLSTPSVLFPSRLHIQFSVTLHTLETQTWMNLAHLSTMLLSIWGACNWHSLRLWLGCWVSPIWF